MRKEGKTEERRKKWTKEGKGYEKIIMKSKKGRRTWKDEERYVGRIKKELVKKGKKENHYKKNAHQDTRKRRENGKRKQEEWDKRENRTTRNKVKLKRR